MGFSWDEIMVFSWDVMGFSWDFHGILMGF